jgi:hypothetical protein
MGFGTGRFEGRGVSRKGREEKSLTQRRKDAKEEKKGKKKEKKERDNF